LLAIATDTPLNTETPQFHLDDAAGIADWIEDMILVNRSNQRQA